MKKLIQKNIYYIPLALWLVIIPVIVKVKYIDNPLREVAWYSWEEKLADFFLYYKSLLVTIVGIVMLGMMCWQIGKLHRKDTLFHKDTKIFIPIIIYLVLAVFSSLFSKYGYFCTHGMPDQFETIWNLIAYIVALFYCYYLIVYQNSEKSLLTLIFAGTALVGIICVLQYFKIDIYRIMYEGKGYTFTFDEGTVYGPFYNTNYVGFYTLLFVPLFALLLIFYKNWKTRLISGTLMVALLISMIGAKSVTAEIALLAIAVFAILFLLIKNTKVNKMAWLPVIMMVVMGIIVCIVSAPRVGAYIQASDTEKKNLESIYTNDDNVEISYKGQKLYIRMIQNDDLISFDLKDQNQANVSSELIDSDQGYYFELTDERFTGMRVTPVMITQDPDTFGFTVFIDDKNWCFSNQMTDDGTYYYYTDIGKLTKLTNENVSADFSPLENMSALASGRGYLWNKTIAILKDYVFLGSGADTFTLVYPNGDFVDKYNNFYDNLIVTKPHNLYLKIAVQTGVLSLICFLVFYLWYFISSLRIYFKQRLDNPLAISGFGIMLGTLGYMISGLANDSTITIAPLYWAMLGIGIGINHRIKMTAE